MRVRGVGAATSLAVALIASACAGGSALQSRGEGGTDGGAGFGPGGAAPCVASVDCPSGLLCEAGACKQPEQEVQRTTQVRPPVASARYVFALNPTADAVARIDPAQLSIESVPVGPEPRDLAALPGEDAVVVLCFQDASLWVVDAATTPSRAVRVPLTRPLGAMAVSPDGRWAVAYPDPALPPASGAEGVVVAVDLRLARMGLPADLSRFERAAGYRVTDVVFRVEAGATTQAYVVSKSHVAVIDLARAAANPLPARHALPASASQTLTAREVVATADGSYLIVRSSDSAELAVFDGTRVSTLSLREVATDIDVLSDGTAALAAIRPTGEVAVIRLPQDIVNPAGIAYVRVTGATVGQLALPPVKPARGWFALAFSNTTEEEALAFVDLAAAPPVARRNGLEKTVDFAEVSGDGATAIVVHRATPDSTVADPYERAVDADQGYTVLDLATGYAQLRRTAKVKPGPLAFSPAGLHAAVALRDDVGAQHQIDALNLASLVARPVSLASAPLFVGPVPSVLGVTPHRVFVSQIHRAGRISVIQLDNLAIRTATGFTLNAQIE